MKIRNAQMEAMSRGLEDAFEKRMVEHLCNDLPEQLEAQGLEKEDLKQLVRRGMKDAEGYGIKSEDGIQQYLDCMAVFGPNFDRDTRHAWAGEILRNTELDSSEKTEGLAIHMLFDVQWEKTPNG